MENVDKKIVKTMEDAIGHVVRCTDGEARLLDRVDKDFGYYGLPIDWKNGIFASCGKTYLGICKEKFIGGEIIDHKFNSFQYI